MIVWWMLSCGPQDAPPTAAPPPPSADGHVDHDHAATGDHMAQMTATRSRLRAELAEAYDRPVPGLDTADPSRGKVTYDELCASCHGPSGKGDGPAASGLDPLPADFTDPFHSRFYSDAGRIRIIEQGSPGTAMAGFGTQLDRQRILDVYAYVASLRPGPSHGDHESR